MDEFDDVEVQDKLHIIISVKDFRAILQHAQMTSGALTTCYSNPGRPMKLSYNTDGVLCEFILMTVGEKDAMIQKHKNPRASAAKAAAAQLDSASHRGSSAANDNQAPPEPASASRHLQQKTPVRPRQPPFEIRPSPMPPPTTARSDSLFVDQAEDDEQWEPVNPDEEEEEETGRLEWNATNEPVLFFLCPRLTCPLTRRGRIRHPYASEVIFRNRLRLKRLLLSGLCQALSRLSGSPTYVTSHRPGCWMWSS
jgi:cell cycle checkpoint control protein RAD9A